MKLTALSLNDALDRAKAMPYAYIRTLSNVYVGITPENVTLNDITEARFFGDNAEIQFLRRGVEMTATEVADEEGDLSIDERTALLPSFGSFLTKRRYILPDEDGQCNIAATRLLKWEGV